MFVLQLRSGACYRYGQAAIPAAAHRRCRMPAIGTK